MNGLSVRLIVLERPLLGPTIPSESAEYTHEWYARIANVLDLPMETWDHEYYARGEIQVKEEVGVLNELRETIKARSSNGYDALILDLSSYRCRAPAWDAIGDEWKKCMKPFKMVIIIFDPFAGAINSDVLKEFYMERKNASENLVIIDFDGYEYYVQEGASIKSRLRPDLCQFSTNISEKAFRNFIMFRSNRSFGHYLLPSQAHVRTHYDIYPVVIHPGAYRYILMEANKLFKKNTFELILGFGLGSAGLMRLCDDLGQSMGVPHLFYHESTKEDLQKQISKGSRKVLLLSDVLLTGKTARSHIKVINALEGEVTGILVVMGLSNSLEQIDDIPVVFCARLNRPFFTDKANCDLCAANYPGPEPIILEKEFRDKMASQPLGYDFWELLKEARALEVGHKVSPNNVNHYLSRVDTERVLSKYGDFIAIVLADQLTKAQGESAVDLIACPKERGAIYLAYALAKQLKIPSARVVSIDRTDIERCPPIGISRDVVKKYEQQFKNRRTLAVDDGCNSLHTFIHLLSLLRAIGASVQGYAVFLNALNDAKMDQTKEEIGNNFFYFYRWQLGPFTRGRCPVCNSQRIFTEEVAPRIPK